MARARQRRPRQHPQLRQQQMVSPPLTAPLSSPMAATAPVAPVAPVASATVAPAAAVTVIRDAGSPDSARSLTPVEQGPTSALAAPAAVLEVAPEARLPVKQQTRGGACFLLGKAFTDNGTKWGQMAMLTFGELTQSGPPDEVLAIVCYPRRTTWLHGMLLCDVMRSPVAEPCRPVEFDLLIHRSGDQLKSCLRVLRPTGAVRLHIDEPEEQYVTYEMSGDQPSCFHLHSRLFSNADRLLVSSSDLSEAFYLDLAVGLEVADSVRCAWLAHVNVSSWDAMPHLDN